MSLRYNVMITLPHTIHCSWTHLSLLWGTIKNQTSSSLRWISSAGKLLRTLCFLDLRQLHEMFEHLNAIRSCTTPNCRGKLVAILVKRKGLGGAAQLTYNCDGCQEQELTLDTCKPDGRKSEMNQALHVAFIISGCTYATYT